MEQCSILFINGKRQRVRQAAALQSIGFVVTEVDDLPTSADLATHHVVVVCPPDPYVLPHVAARLRAAPRFGRRLLLALVAAKDYETVRRDAVVSGFDDVLLQSIGGRQLGAAIIRRLRGIPELRCLLAPITRRRQAA